MCELCEDTLEGTHLDEHTGMVDHRWPCPRCLSYNVTDEVREVAQKWLGFDLWKLDGDPVLETVWWREDYRVIPLWLPAGMDLGARVLAHRWDVDVKHGARWFCWTPATDDLSAGWELAGDTESCRFDSGNAPALVTIPDDAPAQLRAARAMMLTLQATEKASG